MPKGSKKPYNRAERTIIKGMKMAQKKGAGRRQTLHPGAEGTAGGVGTFKIYQKKRKHPGKKK